MKRTQVFAALEKAIHSDYPTGIGWMAVEDDTLDIGWVNDASTQITVVVRNWDPTTKRWVES